MFDESQRFFETFISMNDECNTYLNDNMRESKFVTDLETQFDQNCRGKSRCTLDYDYFKLNRKCLDQVINRARQSWSPNLFNDYVRRKREQDNNFRPAEEYSNDENVPEPVFFFITQCESAFINFLGDDQTAVPKQIVALIIVGTEIAVIIVLIIAYNLIIHMQLDFV